MAFDCSINGYLWFLYQFYDLTKWLKQNVQTEFDNGNSGYSKSISQSYIVNVGKFHTHWILHSITCSHFTSCQQSWGRVKFWVHVLYVCLPVCSQQGCRRSVKSSMGPSSRNVHLGNPSHTSSSREPLAFSWTFSNWSIWFKMPIRQSDTTIIAE